MIGSRTARPTRCLTAWGFALLLLAPTGAAAKVFVARGFDGNGGQFSRLGSESPLNGGSDISLEIPVGGTSASVRIGQADYAAPSRPPAPRASVVADGAPSNSEPERVPVTHAGLAIYLKVEAQANSRIELADLELVRAGEASTRGDYRVVGRIRSLSDHRWIDVADARLSRVSDGHWSFDLAQNCPGAVDRIELQIIPETDGEHYGDDLLAIREISLNGNVVSAPEPADHSMWALLVLAAVAMCAFNWARLCVQRRDALLLGVGAMGDGGLAIGSEGRSCEQRFRWSDETREAVERLISRGLGRERD